MVKREKKLSNKPKKRSKFADEEILSDEASGSEGLSDDFFETTETVEEKRIRLAKQLILNLESSNQDKSEVSRILSNTGVINK